MKPYSQDWWNTLANKAHRQSRYNLKYIKIALFCWERANNI